MQRLASRLGELRVPPTRRPRTTASALQAYRPLPATMCTSTKSAPEEASAESGGPRSKDAEETDSSLTIGAMPDALADRSARGRTGGGKPLESSENPPPQPKIHNASVPGDQEGLTEEQKKEVEQHNENFEKKYDRAAPAADDKVDKNFWSGGGSR